MRSEPAVDLSYLLEHRLHGSGAAELRDPTAPDAAFSTLSAADHLRAETATLFRAVMSSGRSSPTPTSNSFWKSRVATALLPAASVVAAAPFMALKRFAASL